MKTAGDAKVYIRFYLYKLRLIDSVAVHAFDVLGDPVRRRILELLSGGERSSGAVCAVIQEEFGISTCGCCAKAGS